MKIATWNINNVVARLDLLLAWLDATRPDVVALQELKVPDAQFPKDELASLGYASLYVGQKAWNGVALLARGHELVEIRRSLPGKPSDTQARYLEAAINGIVISSLYLPNGNPQPGPKFDYKLAWFDKLNAHAASLWDSGHPVVLAGDYNVVPTEADIYDSTTWRDNALLQPQARAAYAELLEQGWIDGVRHLHPDDRIYTFWDYRRNRWQRNAGLRIDHLLLSGALKRRLSASGVDQLAAASRIDPKQYRCAEDVARSISGNAART